MVENDIVLGEAGLVDLANRVAEVTGVVGVVLGGSRARGEHTEDSDVDLGVYYLPPLNVDALDALGEVLADPTRDLAAHFSSRCRPIRSCSAEP